MLIDNSYFKGELKVPNSQSSLAPLSDRTGNVQKIEEYIQRYERQVLIYALGLTNYNDLISYIDPITGDWIDEGATPQKWLDYVDGTEYQIDGVDFEWKGIRFVEGNQNYSLIAYYVFAKFLPDISTSFGSAGIQKENTKSARGYSSIPKSVDAWNGFIKLYQGDEIEGTEGAKLWSSRGLVGLDYYQRDLVEGDVDMYKYLQDNASEYPGVTTQLFGHVNSFGI